MVASALASHARVVVCHLAPSAAGLEVEEARLEVSAARDCSPSGAAVDNRVQVLSLEALDSLQLMVAVAGPSSSPVT